jgi:hypothetical protein
MDEKLKVVVPYGILYTIIETYYLLSPQPIPGDSWERDNTYRFVCVPIQPEAVEQKGYKTAIVYGYARHVVTNAFAIEYKADLSPITIQVLDELDLSQTEIPIKEEKDVPEENDPF